MNIDPSRCNDIDLWQHFKKGNEEAYSFIYEKYVPILYSYGYRIYPDEDLVKDCLQDLFVTLWSSRGNLANTDSIKYYLFRSLRREIARKLSSATNFTPDPATSVAENVEYPIEDHLIALEISNTQSKELDIALTYLSDRQREAVYLRFYQNIGFEEIAAIMGITHRAVYKLIYRAVDILKKAYIPKSSPPASLPIILLIPIALIFLNDLASLSIGA
jgi:RNA polymerase sigma factor (sigma-70 family)